MVWLRSKVERQLCEVTGRWLSQSEFLLLADRLRPANGEADIALRRRFNDFERTTLVM